MSEGPFPNGDGKVRWVSTEWLDEHIDDKMVIIDCQPNIHDYIREHIPGAIYAEDGLLRMNEFGRPGVYISLDAIESVFGRLGLRRGVPVVVYTGTGPARKIGDGLEQTMWAYTLARFGHDSILILDGGIDKWKLEDRELTQAFPSMDTTDYMVEVNDDYFIDMEELKGIKDNGDVVLLDARPPESYEGQGVWSRPGHIPGAINLPWRTLMSPGNTRLLRPIDEIKGILESKGATEDKVVICSCGTGREATLEFLVAKWLLVYPSVHIYEGSFLEWNMFKTNPTVVGKNPY
jgi:thiosulfate/3-mercaptopyruvate sulfurtransferase